MQALEVAVSERPDVTAGLDDDPLDGGGDAAHALCALGQGQVLGDVTADEVALAWNQDNRVIKDVKASGKKGHVFCKG